MDAHAAHAHIDDAPLGFLPIALDGDVSGLEVATIAHVERHGEGLPRPDLGCEDIPLRLHGDEVGRTHTQVVVDRENGPIVHRLHELPRADDPKVDRAVAGNERNDEKDQEKPAHKAPSDRDSEGIFCVRLSQLYHNLYQFVNYNI